MNEPIQQLRINNPGLRLSLVTEPCFSFYGRVISCTDTSQLSLALRGTPIPDIGNAYVASDKILESIPLCTEMKETVFGGMSTQVGFCNGHGDTLNALEWHKCSEVNFSDTGCVLLMALQSDICSGKLSSADIRAFYLPADTLIEVHPEVLHFAPCQIQKEGFRCLVMLEDGVNAPLPSLPSPASRENAMLWMRGKWLISHPSSPQAAKGAYVGILGDNLKVAL